MAVGPQELFGRRLLLTVADSDGIVAQVTEYTDTPVRSGLRVRFRVSRQVSSDADTATAEIYNLSPQTRAALAQRNIFITRQPPFRYLQISAGHVGNMAAIFNGAVILVTNRREGAEWITSIEARTAAAQQMFPEVEKSYGSKGGKSVRSIVNELFSDAGLSAPKFSQSAERALQGAVYNNFAISGSVYDGIKRVLNSFGLTFNVDVGGVKVTEPGNPTDENDVLEISEDTGLLGTPKVKDYGVEFETLLDPRIHPGQQIRLTSRTLAASTPGIGDRHTVWTMEQQGDTHGNDWKSEISTYFYPLGVGLTGNQSGSQPPIQPRDGGEFSP